MHYIPNWCRRTVWIGVLLWFAVQAKVSSSACAQSSTAMGSSVSSDLSFEVATVKPSLLDGENGNLTFEGRRVNFSNQSLLSLVSLAFGRHDSEIIGLDERFNRTRFDIEAISPLTRSPTLPELQMMLLSLLRERFSLTFHHEKRSLPVFVLSVDHLSSGLRKQVDRRATTPSQTGSGGGSVGTHSRRFLNNSMQDFSFGLEKYMGRPVLDGTNLVGRYDFDLTWADVDVPPESNSEVPDLSTALREQLGLRVAKATKAVDVIVVDKASSPTPN